MALYQSQGKEVGASVTSKEEEGKKPTRSASVLTDVKIPISNMGWACRAAADLLRKAHVPGHSGVEETLSHRRVAAQPPSEGCEQTAATISACGLQ